MGDTQRLVQALIDDLVGRDVERGLQVAVYHDGKLVVDAWSGVADAATRRAVDGETLFVVFSATKGLVATVIHLLAERGKLDYDRPIAADWPEFGCNGKEQVTARMALTHAAGIPQVPDGIGPAEMCNWDMTCRAVAELTPLWEPGSRVGYHALTYGWILGELARRVDGRPFGQLVQEEICRPLELTSLYVGIPDAVEPRVATLEAGLPPADLSDPPPQALIWRAIPPSCQPLNVWGNRADIRRATVPGGNGIMNARSLARHYAALAGAAPGPSILSAERFAIATALQRDDDDLVIGPGRRRALGYEIGGGNLSLFGPSSTAFGHTGAGGSIGFADPEQRFAFALAKTRMVNGTPGDSAAYLVAQEARAALGIPY